MRIVHIVDSLEINGGSMMCFEIASAMRRMLNYPVECLVVSKTGKYGRKGILAKPFADAYGWKMPSINYAQFKERSPEFRDDVILHHRLECTRPLSFKKKPRLYLVINHTIQKLDRIQKFKNADLIVSVCEHLRHRSPRVRMPHKVVLNGISQNKEQPVEKGGSFVTGRCHRLPSSKFSVESLRFLDSMNLRSHIHYLAGPKLKEIVNYERKNPKSCLRYLQKLDDQKKKQALLRSFDLYLYDTYGPEGASVAILEGVAAGVPVLCKPMGGNKELVRDGVNGFYYNKLQEAGQKIKYYYDHPDELEELKKNVEKDFKERLSVEKCVDKYYSLIEKWKK